MDLKYVALVCVICVHIGVLLFTAGFLMTKLELGIKSNCSMYAQMNGRNFCKDSSIDPISKEHSSKSKPNVDISMDANPKVMLFIIDALRLDFMKKPESFHPENIFMPRMHQLIEHLELHIWVLMGSTYGLHLARMGLRFIRQMIFTTQE